MTNHTSKTTSTKSTATSAPTTATSGSAGTADETRREVTSAAKSLADDARSAARDAADAATSEVRARADDAKKGVAGEVSNVAHALRKAAEGSRTGSPQERTFGQIAEGLADVSETIANKDLGEMAADISDFARRNPLVFLGGAALIGFAATRFAKAHRPEPSGQASQGAAYGQGSMATGSGPAGARPGSYQSASNGGVS